MTDLPESVMTVNEDYAETSVAEFTPEWYQVLVGAAVGREYDGGVYRQVHLYTENKVDHAGDSDECELLLSISEATSIRDMLTRAIALAAAAPEPEEGS